MIHGRSNRIKISSDGHKPSHNLIGMQVVDENFRRARNFKVLEGSRDAGVECPKTIARVNLKPVDGYKTDVAAVVLLETGSVMFPVWIGLEEFSVSRVNQI